MSPLVKLVTQYYLRDPEEFQDFIKMRLDLKLRPWRIGFDFGQFLSDRLRYWEGSSDDSDIQAFLTVAADMFSNLDKKAATQVGQEILKKYEESKH